MSSFIATFRSVFSKGELYEKPENNRFGEAFKYIVSLVILASAFKVVMLSLTLIPMMAQVKPGMIDLMDRYPGDLVLTFEKGKLAMNRPSPYVVPAVKGGFFDFGEKNIVVIDTARGLDVEAFEAYDTSILVTRDGLISHKDHGIKVHGFKGSPDFVLSRDFVEKHRDSVTSFATVFSIAGPVIVPLMFLFLFGLFGLAGVSFMALIGSLVVLVVTRVKGHLFSFSGLYVLALYGLTPVILVGAFSFVFQTPLWADCAVLALMISLYVPRRVKAETPAL